MYGSRFRRVDLDDASMRGGLLRHGSILTVTSYATRTSPVLRGKWVLDNLLGVPTTSRHRPDRAGPEGQHRRRAPLRPRQCVSPNIGKNKACARCHNVIDPVGLSLENVRCRRPQRRRLRTAWPIPASGACPTAAPFTYVTGLEAALLARPELLASTITEKLLTYACGRGVEPSDAPAVRAIVRAAQPNEYRLSSIVLGVVQSEPFQMRTSR